MNIQELKEKDPERYEKEYWKWREYAAEYEWWDDVYEMAKEDAKPKGMRVDEIFFSGFWSQGDGASWVGEVDVIPFLKAKGLEAEPMWFTLIALIRDGWIDDKATVDGGGYRVMTTKVRDFAMNSSAHDGGVVSGGVLAGANVLDLLDAFGGDEALDALEELMNEAAEDYAGDIYRMLENEYEHLTSEEMFESSCECNEIEFDDEGDE